MGLTKQGIRSLPPGRYADSGPTGVRGLYLKVTDGDGRSWLGRTKVGGKTEYFGLGSTREVTLTEARENWVKIKKRLRSGETISEVKGRAVTPTFGNMLYAAYASREKRMTGSKKDQWVTAVERHLASLLDVPVEEITAPRLLEAITPCIEKTPETARKVLVNTNIVFNYAAALGMQVFNPVPPVRQIAPWPKREVRHHPALTVEQAPEVFQTLMKRTTASAAAVCMGALTGARSRSVRNMSMDQIKGDTWLVPGEFMKSGQPFVYPLSPLAMKLVEDWSQRGDPVVFANPQGEALGSEVLNDNMDAWGVTMHGWRSTLVDFVRMELRINDSDMHAAILAHRLPGALPAYARSTLLEQRREILVAWEAFLCT